MVLPLVAVWMLPAASGVLDVLASILVCVLLSLGAAQAGARLWGKYEKSSDLLFSDLLLWGWLRRLWTERQLEKVVARGGSASDHQERLLALTRMSELLESRDMYTRRHSTRVARIAVGIGRGLGLPAAELGRLRTAAILHDVGKICTPRDVLNKPDALSDVEFDIVTRHPAQGAAMLEGLVDDATVAMVRHHHERLGGTGYPDGLAGDTIPLGARIIAVADTFDAITSARAYRPARPHDHAIRVLRAEAGVDLDAAAVRAFLAHYSGTRSVRWWSIGAGLGGALNPLRQLVAQISVGGGLPVLGASAMVAAPALGIAAALAPASTHQRDANPRAAEVRTEVARDSAAAGPTIMRRGASRHPALMARFESMRVHRPGEGRRRTSTSQPRRRSPVRAIRASRAVEPSAALAGAPAPTRPGSPAAGEAPNVDPTPTNSPAPGRTSELPKDSAPSRPPHTPKPKAPKLPRATPAPDEPEPVKPPKEAKPSKEERPPKESKPADAPPAAPSAEQPKGSPEKAPKHEKEPSKDDHHGHG